MSLCIKGCLTVYFECPFWVAVFEREHKEKLQVCRIVLGTSEPKDYEIYEMVAKYYFDLKFSKPMKYENCIRPKVKNPKRLQREIKKSVSEKGISTKSQEAIRLEREQSKLERKIQSRSDKLRLTKEKYVFKQEKKKEKKRGH